METRHTKVKPESRPADDDALAFAISAARLATDLKTEAVVVLDMRGISSLADVFVIGTGTSDRQMHSVLDQISAMARKAGRRPFNVADPQASAWILADYVDVMIHLFDAAHRDYYDLDGLWGDAPRVAWRPDVLPNARNTAADAE